MTVILGIYYSGKHKIIDHISNIKIQMSKENSKVRDNEISVVLMLSASFQGGNMSTVLRV
jgi:hypothetical protein